MRKIVIIFCLAMLLLSSVACAEPQTYTATGEYVMSPKETLEDGIKHAREDALRLISESVGVYVESQSEAKNQELTRDEIRTMSASIIRVTNESGPVIVQHGSGLDIKMTVTAEADTDQLFTEQKKKNDALEWQNASLKCDADEAAKDAASAFNQECFAYAISSSYDMIESEAKSALKDNRNPWKQACAKKWLGVVAFQHEKYDDGLKLCEEAVDSIVALEKNGITGISFIPVDLMYETADACIYYCKDIGRTEAYLQKAEFLKNTSSDRCLVNEGPEVHIRQCIQSLREGGDVVPYDGYTTNELVFY